VGTNAALTKIHLQRSGKWLTASVPKRKTLRTSAFSQGKERLIAKVEVHALYQSVVRRNFFQTISIAYLLGHEDEKYLDFFLGQV
jgi:hypothetical protein